MLVPVAVISVPQCVTEVVIFRVNDAGDGGVNASPGGNSESGNIEGGYIELGNIDIRYAGGVMALVVMSPEVSTVIVP